MCDFGARIHGLALGKEYLWLKEWLKVAKYAEILPSKPSLSPDGLEGISCRASCALSEDGSDSGEESAFELFQFVGVVRISVVEELEDGIEVDSGSRFEVEGVSY